jgi:integrase
MLAEDDTVSMAVHLLFFTGQRIGDVCDMTWDSVAGGIINITQEKTDKVIFFRLSKRLMAELEKAPRRGKTILTGVNGGRKNDNLLRVELNAFVATFGFKRVSHGLRKNAVNSLLEAGCTHHEVSSVTVSPVIAFGTDLRL